MPYTPTTWLSGDLITAAKANNWETQYTQSFADSVKYSEINRQTVIEGATSSTDGTANFITGSTTALTAFATASTGEPLLLSFANGNSTLGGLNYDVSLTTTSSWTGLTASNTNYLYFQTSTAGVLTQNQTIVPPQYGYFFDTTKNSLIHFDGTAGSTITTDNFGNTWTNFGTAALSTTQIKFGTTSLTLPGSVGSYVQSTNIADFGNDGWTIEGWCYINSTAANRTIVSSVNPFGFALIYNSVTGHFNVYLANSTSAYDIDNTSSGTTTITSSVWHSWSITYNSSTYKLWIDGANDFTHASTLLLNTVLGGIRHGLDGSAVTPFSGFLDEFRFTKDVSRYNAVYTPSTSAFTSDIHFFDINKAKMYFGDPTAWTEVIRVFVGEAVTSASVVSSIITYALKGKYDSGWFAVTATTNYSKSHNIGISIPNNCITIFYFSLDQSGADSSFAHDIYVDTTNQIYGHFNRENIVNGSRNIVYFGFTTFVQVFKSVNRTSGYYRIYIKRDW